MVEEFRVLAAATGLVNNRCVGLCLEHASQDRRLQQRPEEYDAPQSTLLQCPLEESPDMGLHRSL